jgi:hypothetical protein
MPQAGHGARWNHAPLARARSSVVCAGLTIYSVLAKEGLQHTEQHLKDAGRVYAHEESIGLWVVQIHQRRAHVVALQDRRPEKAPAHAGAIHHRHAFAQLAVRALEAEPIEVRCEEFEADEVVLKVLVVCHEIERLVHVHCERESHRKGQAKRANDERRARAMRIDAFIGSTHCGQRPSNRSGTRLSSGPARTASGKT